MDDLTAFVAARLGEREHFAKIARLAQKHREQMLREVEADRCLLAEWQKAEADPAVDDQWNAGLAAGLRLAVQIRTARYSGHPGYRPQWKP